MKNTPIISSLKNYLSGLLAALLSAVLLFLPADTDNVLLSVKETGFGTDEISGTYCCVTVNMANRTNRTIGKPDYALLEKSSEGEWSLIGKGCIPEEDYWTLIHGRNITEAFYFSVGDSAKLSAGEYRLTVHYSVRGLSSNSDSKSSTVFTIE